MSRRSEIMVESLSALASRHGWSLELAEETSYVPAVVLFKENLAISVGFEIREAEIWCTCYWLPGPYASREERHLSSWCLFSFGLHEFIAERAEPAQARRDRKRLIRTVRPKNETAFRAHVEEVAELIETYAPDVLAGDNTALERLGRAGPEGRRRGYSSLTRDAADKALQRKYELREKWGGIGCGVVIAIGILAAANSCHR